MKAGLVCAISALAVLVAAGCDMRRGVTTVPAATGATAGSGQSPAGSPSQKQQLSPEQYQAIIARVEQYTRRLEKRLAQLEAERAQERSVRVLKPAADVRSGPASQSAGTSAGAVEQPAAEIAQGQAGSPPAVTELTVSGAPASRHDTAAINRPANIDQQDAAASVQQGLDSLIKALRTRLAAEPSDYADQLRLRILYVLNNRDADARNPIADVTEIQQRLISALVETLIAIRDAGVEPGSIEPAAAAIEQLRDELRSTMPLRIPTLTICKRVDGFGVYEEFAPAKFVAGKRQPVIAYCELENFRSVRNSNGQFLTKLKLLVTIYDQAGKELYRDASNTQLVDSCRHRRRDFFLAVPVTLPPTLKGGKYVLKVSIQDTQADKIATASAEFEIVE